MYTRFFSLIDMITGFSGARYYPASVLIRRPGYAICIISSDPTVKGMPDRHTRLQSRGLACDIAWCKSHRLPHESFLAMGQSCRARLVGLVLTPTAISGRPVGQRLAESWTYKPIARGRMEMSEHYHHPLKSEPW